MTGHDLTDEARARLDWYVTHRTGRGGCRTRHLGLCGRVDKSGASATVEGWTEIHPAFRCAACDWILREETSRLATLVRGLLHEADSHDCAEHAGGMKPGHSYCAALCPNYRKALREALP